MGLPVFQLNIIAISCWTDTVLNPNPPNGVGRALEQDITGNGEETPRRIWDGGASSRPVAGERSRSCSGRSQQGTLAGRFVRREWERPSTDC